MVLFVRLRSFILQNIFAWLLLSMLLSLMVTAIPAHSTENVICDRHQGKKLCLEIQLPSSNGNAWLWIKSNCEDGCTQYDNYFVARYSFVENLPKKELGLELYSAEMEESFLASCSVNKKQSPMPAVINFPVTKSEYLHSPTNISELLTDLAKISPDPDILNQRYQQILSEPWWLTTILAHLSTAAVTLILFNCFCYYTAGVKSVLHP